MERPLDPQWPRLVSLAVHELRTPATVVAGYIRMLLKQRAGAITDQQRRLLEEADKSCGRLSALLAEMSDLANFETNTESSNPGAVDLHALLAHAIASLPASPDREVTITLSPEPGSAFVQGDAVRLTAAFTSLLVALRRELVTTAELVVRDWTGEYDGRPATWIAIGGADRIDSLAAAGPEGLTTFDEWRGGCGLSLAVARRVVNAHGGTIWSPADGSKAGAVVVLPRH